MSQKRPGLMIVGIAALLLGACGGGSSGGGGANVAPVANAGTAQTVSAGTSVSLNGSASSDPDGSIAAFAWTQTAGTAVTLNSAVTSTPSFVAPTVSSVSTFTFRLVVTDNSGATSGAATVTVTVNPLPSADVITGIVRFGRVPFRSTAPFVLDYANPVMQASRGVLVKALNPGNLAEIASSTTNASGGYSLSVPANSTVVIQVLAQMQQGGTPRWNMRVQNGSSGVAPYSYSTAALSSNGGARNIDIPTGIPANGGNVAISARLSGPFAILDTIYTAMQPVLGVAPNTAFPDLVVDWGVQTDGTQFVVSGTSQTIQLLSNLVEDADEFDQHVVAHEFGHYIENNFSRSDSFGGSHAAGDKLDMRVAFSEGFGNAFAAMVLNDPVARDSYVSAGQQFSAAVNLETNPGPASGCWCSETSMASILWDLYDSVPDGSDSISLGFAPIWAALTGTHRDTPAFTSIFTFITALKAVQPGSVTAINALVSAQNINAAGINDFATNETNAPFANLLPLYTTINRGVPAVVRSINDGGLINKAGNSGLLRFVSDLSGNVTMTATTSNSAPDADPDFEVYRNGVLVKAGSATLFKTETQQFPVASGTTYAIDVYECPNACFENSTTSGDFNITVTIN